ncbi:MAG: murein DD-endopeptidase MepM/ murein hydrolase activator NlpD [Paracoccaceae bacterium]|jgi:murein DD-endopeptidase MepM/ murein hydrolase activator NlpD
MSRIDDRAKAVRPRGWCPAERNMVIRTDTSTRYVRVSPAAQLGLGVAFAALIGWSAFSTASWIVAGVERDALASRLTLIDHRFDGRIEGLTHDHDTARGVMAAERDMLRADLNSHETRLTDLTRELSQQQVRLVDAAEAERELTIALETLRAKLRDAVSRRDAAVTDEAFMAQTLEMARERLAAADAAENDWSATMQAVSDALEDAASARDLATRDAGLAGTALVAMRTQIAEDRARREQMFSQLEDAVQVGLGALEGVFDRAGLDVNALVDTVRREYAGAGGPFIPVSATFDDEVSAMPGSEAARVASLMGGLERASLMKIAVDRLPLAKPVRASFRFTSGFGVRRDPKNGRARMHNGTDFAAGRGTAIYATGEGVVTFAGWQSGYGRVVKIRHAFGFETVYAHMDKTRTRVGDRVAQGDRIGDMGSTGRSTGVHLHYEVRVLGKPVNPLKYIEAARNVL